MPNFDVKRKIQSLCDVLVDKTPDPKMQVEKITTAMIYKFMDDIDLKNVNLGGNREYFKDTYEKYSWSHIMDSNNSASQRVELFSQGINEMVKNDNLPQFFRDIFRGAYITYNDVNTCDKFLKEINDFQYSDNKDLSNAYEILLMIMGKDAGQFITPRHIIDMIVNIVEPTKNDTILDPVCGTAGFLVSAYKFIMNKNKDKDGKSTLTPTEREKLSENFCGYEFLPDMVMLSRINMYLHNFTKPNINEYDTLTSLDKWDDKFDLVLAKPPFIISKDSIVPHERYHIKTDKTELLFVDYIAEHLTANGKAGIIVTEEIVSQSGISYKSLREFIVKDNLLYAVISLPAGIFNPYSGIKASILLFDKTVAKKRNKILFVKITNDGFDLSAHRREIKYNDIPRTVKIIKRFKESILKDIKFELSETEKDFSTLATIENIAQQDYILVDEKYKKTVDYPMVELREVCEIKKGTLIKKEKIEAGYIPVIDGRKEPIYFHNVANRNGNIITVSASAEFINFFEQPIFATSHCSTIQVKNNRDKINLKFIYYLLKDNKDEFYKLRSGTILPRVSTKDIKTIKIPLPPLEIQQKIVEEIETEQAHIEFLKKIIKDKIKEVWDYRSSFST